MQKPSSSRRAPRSFGLRPALTLILGLGLAAAGRAEDTLKDIFSPAEYSGAGLDKLDQREQAVLLRALQQRGLGQEHAAPAPAVRHEGQVPEKKSLWGRIRDFGAEQLPTKNAKDEGEVTEVDAQLTEPFAGLSGHTLFRLDNGQTWQQRLGETYIIGQPIPNPKVTILRTRFGYRLKIPAAGAGFDVAIKRIQ